MINLNDLKQLACSSDKDHEWVPIYYNPPKTIAYIYREVIQWCKKCGCVRIDKEHINFNGFGYSSYLVKGEIAEAKVPDLVNIILDAESIPEDIPKTVLEDDLDPLDLEFLIRKGICDE